MTTPLHHREHVELVANQLAVSSDSQQLIANSWRRCLAKHQLDPDRPPAVQVLESQQLRERSQRHDYLMGVAQQELVDLYNQMQGSGFNVFLTDAEGIILQQVCDPNYAASLRRAGAHLGADWSEPNSGTNGVGTCIIEQRPLTVHLNDHFHTKHTRLSCTSAPIRDPQGALLAILDSATANIDTPVADKHMLGLVRNSASFIEGLYFLRFHRSDLIIYLGINPDIVPQPRNAMLAVSANGRITGANDRALQALGAPGRHTLLGREVQQLFDLRGHPLNASTAGQIYQLRLLDRGTQVFATWQVPSPKTTNAYSNEAPLTELSSLAKAQPTKPIWGDDGLERNFDAATELLNQNINVVLHGETGTGKDTLARALHQASRFKNGIFIDIDCSSVTEAELDSLFSDADEMLTLSLYPDGGTLFLNDAHLLPANLQVLLLELMLRLERCNSHHPQGFNVITSSREDLQTAVDNQLFRQDLFYRLAQYHLDIPPLRERSKLQAHVQHLLQLENTRALKQSQLADDALALLLQHRWQGNSRELQSALRTAVTLHKGAEITAQDLPSTLHKAATAADGRHDETLPKWTGLEAAEYSALLRELRSCDWNISATAKALNISRNTLYRRMEKYNISPEQDAQS